MFGVQRGQGAVTLCYNSTYTDIITNLPCTPPAPCTLDSIPHSDTLTMHMCIPLCAYRYAPLYNINTYDPCTCTTRHNKHTRYNTNRSRIIRIPKFALGTPA